MEGSQHRASPDITTKTAPLLAIVVAATLFQACVQTVMLPLLPVLPAITGADRATVSWLVTITLLVGAVVNPIFGRLADMYGKKLIFIAALVMMTTGSAVCAATSDIGWLLMARGLQGAGSAVVPVGIALLRDQLPKAVAGQAIAMVAASLGLGASVAIPFSAVVSQYLHWHVTFVITTILGALTVVAAGLVVRESARNPVGTFDGIGAIGLSVALVALLLPITQGANWGWTSPLVWSLSAASSVLFCCWTLQQLRHRYPLVNLRLLAERKLLVPNLITFLVGFAFFGNLLITTQLLQGGRDGGAGYGLSMVVAAACQIPASVAMMSLARIAARSTTRFGARRTMLVGAAFLTVGYGIHSVPHKPLWGVIGALFVTSVGTAICYSTLPLLIVEAAPADEIAASTGMNAVIRTVGSTTCSAMVAAVLSVFAAGDAHGSPSWSGFTAAYLTCCVCSAIVIAAAILLPGKPARSPVASPT
ncbi:MFS transporter [Gordonia sp. NPDC127522]|uniref:MFS transporter n=1 Tax=Gordonia sp. NPDC127522 TaxID=3345390 RepID=UPI00363033AC